MPQYDGMTSIDRLAHAPVDRTMLLREHVRTLGESLIPHLSETNRHSAPRYEISLPEKGGRARAGGDADAYLAFTPKDGFGPPFTKLGPSPSLVLWFTKLTDENPDQWWGVELYIQARGARVVKGEHADVVDWTETWKLAGEAHQKKADEWLAAMLEFIKKLPDTRGAELILLPRTFKGTSMTWQSGIEAPAGPKLRPTEKLSFTLPVGTIVERGDAAATLMKVKRHLWHWPTRTQPRTKTDALRAARSVRKPSVSYQIREHALPDDTSPECVASWLVGVFDDLMARRS